LFRLNGDRNVGLKGDWTRGTTKLLSLFNKNADGRNSIWHELHWSPAEREASEPLSARH
jgi:hypothetical protein